MQEGPVLTDNTNQGTTTAANKPDTTDAPASTEATAEETAPQKPPRPLTEAQKNQQILKEAFPGVDDGVIKAVLSASRGKVEPAFNALLGKSIVNFERVSSHTD